MKQPSTIRILRKMRHRISESGTAQPSRVLAELDAAIHNEERVAAGICEKVLGIPKLGEPSAKSAS